MGDDTNTAIGNHAIYGKVTGNHAIYGKVTGNHAIYGKVTGNHAIYGKVTGNHAIYGNVTGNHDTLTHHGILGMRWGIRRTPAQLARARGVSSTDSPTQTKESSSTKTATSSVKALNDDELRERVKRLQLEKQYRELTRKDKSAGVKFVNEVILKPAQSAAAKYAEKYMAAKIEELLKKTTK